MKICTKFAKSFFLQWRPIQQKIVSLSVFLNDVRTRWCVCNFVVNFCSSFCLSCVVIYKVVVINKSKQQS